MSILTRDEITVHGKKYIIQHPSNREWLKIKQSMVDFKTQQLDLEKLYDYVFENCVFTNEPNIEKPTLDNIDGKESATWEALIMDFFRTRVIPSKFKKNNGVDTSESITE